MIRAADHHQRLGRQGNAQHLVGMAGCRELGAIAHHQIEAPVHQRFQQLLRRPAGHGYAHRRVIARETDDGVSQQGLQGIGAGADADGAGGRLLQPARFLFEIGGGGDHVARGADQAFGGAGRPDIVRRAVEQRGIQFAFQLLDRPRQGGLGEAKLVRRPREIADAVERFEMAEPAQVHQQSPYHSCFALPSHRTFA
jgi:hypothetical protein